eukprot:1906169-Pyramimonas_sp.AAC.1
MLGPVRRGEAGLARPLGGVGGQVPPLAPVPHLGVPLPEAGWPRGARVRGRAACARPPGGRGGGGAGGPARGSVGRP